MKTTFRRDGERYIVFGDGERIGFVRKDGKQWNAVDTYMDKSQNFTTRELAIAWLVELAEKEAQ